MKAMVLSREKKIVLGGLGVLAVGLVVGYSIAVFSFWDEGQSDPGSTKKMTDNQRETGVSTKNRNGKEGGYGNGRNGSGAEKSVGIRGGSARGSCLADDCLAVGDLEYPVGTLSEEAKSAVLAALDDEYKAHATYEAVMVGLGRVRPFVMISRAEEQHISALKSILDKYGIATPTDSWIGKVTAPMTFEASCQVGYDAEVANATLYKDELLPKVTDYPDIMAVFTNLMNASQDKHLPAFDRCRE